MSDGWLRQKERGSRAACRIMIWLARHAGRNAARLLLYPITLYFVLFARGAVRSVVPFLERALGRPIGWRDRFHHVHVFASTILDRVYLLAGDYDQFQADLHGLDELKRCLDLGQGCILLGSHLGSFEIVRTVGVCQRKLEIKVLMHQENAPMIREMLRHLNPEVADSVIPAGMPDTMLRAKECLDRAGVVGILGDRLVTRDQVVPCKFFGELAAFPAGPILLASVLKVPVFLFFGLYRGGNRYEIHFERFAESMAVDRQEREQQVRQWVQRYADRLEHYARLAPDNWFHFYDFWNEQA
jgi:predicted LPLAT superfamily acyltransferase